ncbi:hypothetical protein K431DRAFT_322505 [Polychaeton citri CBS 116435]|uniref:DUF1295-domain-containing protein n=1 Tax=Polychaeton citri CBS 116435 TaxID=1314669 RepID=A0A9P4Q4M1_9PEZI|nr:hypothetical protein K431DRAFT_322505 [Polychaeton citri CBS 116435]
MSFFRGNSTKDQPPTIQVQVADRAPHQFQYQPGQGLGPSPDYGAQYRLRQLFDVGIFKDTIAPTFAINAGLATIAWGIGRATNRVEAKDWLWPSVPIINAWWSALGKRVVFDGVKPSHAWSSLSWVERVLLSGVTLWGGRLLYRVASRSIARGKDEPRYDARKKEEGFWNKALVQTFLPEAIATTLISIPYAGPFRHHVGATIRGYRPWLQMAAVGLYTSGLTLETVADYQLDTHKASGAGGIFREGVWSLCRHPNYLGDALVHFSLTLLLYSSDILVPLELLGPIANYVFLRRVGGDSELETAQMERYEKEDPLKHSHMKEYQAEKNALWPRLNEFSNPWAWTIIGAGVAGALIERGLKVLDGGLFYSAN